MLYLFSGIGTVRGRRCFHLVSEPYLSRMSVLGIGLMISDLVVLSDNFRSCLETSVFPFPTGWVCVPVGIMARLVNACPRCSSAARQPRAHGSVLPQFSRCLFKIFFIYLFIWEGEGERCVSRGNGRGGRRGRRRERLVSRLPAEPGALRS